MLHLLDGHVSFDLDDFAVDAQRCQAVIDLRVEQDLVELNGVAQDPRHPEFDLSKGSGRATKKLRRHHLTWDDCIVFVIGHKIHGRQARGEIRCTLTFVNSDI